MFAALDLDGNGTLDLAELSRHPGELRALRFRDAHARALFDALDLNKNGKIDPNEFHMRAEDFTALDANNDGAVQLDVRRNSKASRIEFTR